MVDVCCVLDCCIPCTVATLSCVLDSSSSTSAELYKQTVFTHHSHSALFLLVMEWGCHLCKAATKGLFFSSSFTVFTNVHVTTMIIIDKETVIGVESLHTTVLDLIICWAQPKQSKIEGVMGGLLSGKKEDDKTEGEGERGKNAIVRPPFKCNPYVLKRTRCNK